MDRIYQKANDQHVVATYVYVKADDVYAYSDVATTKKIDLDTLLDIFQKGCLIVNSGYVFKPVSFNAIEAGGAALTYVMPDANTATTAVLTLLYSSEYIVPEVPAG